MSAGHIRPRGPGAWEIKHDIGRDLKTGRRITKYATVRGAKRDAQRALRELLGAVDDGTHVDRSKLAVGEYVRARINQWHGAGKIGGRTAENYRDMLARHIEPHIGSVRLQKLTTADVERWHTTLRQRGICARSIQDMHKVLSRALNEAVRHNLVVRNVVALEKAPRAEREEMVILTAEQIKVALSKLDGHQMQVPVIVALYTGMRRAEMLALRWASVDLDTKVIRVREALEETRASGVVVKAPKTAAGRRDIRLPEIVVSALRGHRRAQLEVRMALGQGKMPDDALVFPADPAGGHLSPMAFSQRWGRTVRKLGLPAVSWHSLRHSHASMLIDAGVDVVTISKRLGHASPDITLKVYAHLYRLDDGKAADAINVMLAKR
jgi:integrase